MLYYYNNNNVVIKTTVTMKTHEILDEVVNLENLSTALMEQADVDISAEELREAFNKMPEDEDVKEMLVGIDKNDDDKWAYENDLGQHSKMIIHRKIEEKIGDDYDWDQTEDVIQGPVDAFWGLK